MLGVQSRQDQNCRPSRKNTWHRHLRAETSATELLIQGISWTQLRPHKRLNDFTNVPENIYKERPKIIHSLFKKNSSVTELRKTHGKVYVSGKNLCRCQFFTISPLGSKRVLRDVRPALNRLESLHGVMKIGCNLLRGDTYTHIAY